MRKGALTPLTVVLLLVFTAGSASSQAVGDRVTLVERALGVPGHPIPGKSEHRFPGGAAVTITVIGGVERIDARSKVVLPGLINTHPRLFQTLLEGPGDDKPLHERLNRMTLPAATQLIEEECYLVRWPSAPASQTPPAAPGRPSAISERYPRSKRPSPTLHRGGRRCLIC